MSKKQMNLKFIERTKSAKMQGLDWVAWEQ